MDGTQEDQSCASAAAGRKVPILADLRKVCGVAWAKVSKAGSFDEMIRMGVAEAMVARAAKKIEGRGQRDLAIE